MKKYFKVFSATTFQIICNQLFGLLFFILLSSFVSKDIFGSINWSIALTITVSIILTFGFDYIVVRRISAGNDPQNIAGTYLSHTVIVSFICIGLLTVHHMIAPVFYADHDLLYFIAVSTLFTYISGPYKQLAMGMQKFWSLAIMSVTANFIRVSGLIFLIITDTIDPVNIKILFVCSGFVELLLCIVLTHRILGGPLKMTFNGKLYKALVKESLPQTGTVLLDSAFARMDWILMGVLSTNVFTADYSFSYKAFESSRIPLLIIAPVLLPKLSKIYSKDAHFNEDVVKQLNVLWKVESFICMLIPLILNVCWVDIVNIFTHNKYGTDTRWVYMILSLSIPMLFVTNYLWTIAFAKGKIKLTFYISVIVTISNLLLNIILIPRYNAIGAAIASTGGIFIQFLLYYITVKEKRLNIPVLDFIKTFVVTGGIVALCVTAIHLHWMINLVIAVSIFILAALLMGIRKYVRPF